MLEEGLKSAAEAGAGAAQASDSSARQVLFLCDFSFRHVGTVRDHVTSFKKYSVHRVCVADAQSAAKVGLDFGLFDVLVLHYSITISSRNYLPEVVAKKVRDFEGYKVLFIQDEYRWVDRTVAAIADLGIDVIYTVVNEEAVDQIYHHPEIAHVRRKVTLTGFVPEELAMQTVLNYTSRPIDVGYRARRLPAWLGQFAQEKWLIGQRFKEDAVRYGLNCDIEHGENRRLYGERWISFVSSCKAMLGTESGASFIDFSGIVQPQVEELESRHPDVPFDEVRRRFLQGDGETVIRVISPRCFEAAALRTLMVLYPGSYSGVLTPWRHYVPLERDHSNMKEVVAVLRDPERAGEIIDYAYREVALNERWSFRAMVEEFDGDIEEHAGWPRTSKAADAANSRDATPVAMAADLSEVERKVDRYYCYRRRNVLLMRYGAYIVAHWLIKHLVPANQQRRVTARVRNVARRLSSG